MPPEERPQKTEVFKKILMILGVIFLAEVIIGVIGFSIFIVKGSALNKESKAYVDRVVPIILSDLKKETLLQYADDQLKNSSKPEEVDKIFNYLFPKLGKFKEYKGSEGGVHISGNLENRIVITGYYKAQVEFETGPAVVKVAVIKKGDDWKITGFNIESTAFAN